MERTEKDRIIIEKAEFYKSNEIKAHVRKIGMGKYVEGLFVSGLEKDSYFWFIENRSSIPIRLFLNEIYDIEDFIEEVKDGR